MKDHLHIESGTGAADGRGVSNPAGELVRFAEKLLEQGDITQALECLQEAVKRQPENVYIPAVIQRAESMRQAPDKPRRTPGQSPLAVTVDSRHPGGLPEESTDSSVDVEARIRRLTLVASRLFDRGAFDAAFESLMKAYLLDPGNPLVTACEKQMMPVWKTLHKTGLAAYTPDELLVTRRRAQVIQAAATPAPAPPVQQAQQESAARLEERKRQLEQQRRDREQTIWRNASQLPKTMANPKPKEGPRPAPPRLRDLGKYDRPGLLRWLKGN